MQYRECTVESLSVTTMILLLAFLLSASLVCLTAADTRCFPGLYLCDYHPEQCCCKHDAFGNLAKCFPDGSLKMQNRTGWFVTCYNDILVLGFGPYTRKINNNSYILPQEASDPCNVTQTVCEDINRKGTLCSQCMSGYTVSVNTYDLKCVPDKECNWFLTLLAVFGPLTIFYLIVFLFRINAAAPYISLVILLAQILSTRQIADIFLSRDVSKSNIANKFLISLYSVWNLDVLQVYMPPMCLGKHFGNLEVLAFQYLIALFPLILVLVTYALAELHARQWWCVYWLLWPIVKLFKVLRISIDPMRSIMNTFATFVLLSFTKFTIVSVIIIAFTDLRDVNGTVVAKAPLYDGGTKYFSAEHLPYAVLAIVVLLFCNVLPLLLLFLSPMRSFQRCLSSCCCSFRCVHFVNTFLEVFQGHFKDRVSHHRDYRFVAGLQFLLRLIVLVIYSIIHFPELVCLISAVIFLLWSVGCLMFKPYKRELHNVLESILSTCYVFVNLVILYLYILFLKDTSQNQNIPAGIITLVTPGILFGVHVFVQVLMHCGCHTKLFSRLKMLYESASEHTPILKWSGIDSTANNTSPPPRSRSASPQNSNERNAMINYGSVQS